MVSNVTKCLYYVTMKVQSRLRIIPLTGINPGKFHGQGPWVSYRKHRLDDKLVGKQEDTFLLDILMMVVRLQ